MPTAAGFVNYRTDLDNPDFAGIAPAVGLLGSTVEKADELDVALEAAFANDGPALVDVKVARQELAMPPKVSLEQARGFALYTARTILSGDGDEIIDLAKSNLRQLVKE